MKKSNESSQDGRLSQFLQSEIGKYLKVITITIAVVSGYFTTQMQMNRMEDSIKTIETNHLTHLQKSYETITDTIKEHTTKEDEKFSKIMSTVAQMQLDLKAVMTLMNQKL